MNRNFLKFGLFLVLVLSIALLYSCGKSEDDGGASTIKATSVVNNVHNAISDSEVITVKAVASDGGVIAETQYKNKGFTLELPSTVPDKYLQLILQHETHGISISDESAKAFTLENINIRGYDKDNYSIGYFSFNGSIYENTEHYVSWVYVDRDVTVKGEVYTDLSKYDLDLKKGWNVVYNSYKFSTDIYSYTTQKPDDKYGWGWRSN